MFQIFEWVWRNILRPTLSFFWNILAGTFKTLAKDAQKAAIRLLRWTVPHLLVIVAALWLFKQPGLLEAMIVIAIMFIGFRVVLNPIFPFKKKGKKKGRIL